MSLTYCNPGPFEAGQKHFEPMREHACLYAWSTFPIIEFASILWLLTSTAFTLLHSSDRRPEADVGSAASMPHWRYSVLQDGSAEGLYVSPRTCTLQRWEGKSVHKKV